MNPYVRLSNLYCRNMWVATFCGAPIMYTYWQSLAIAWASRCPERKE